MVKKENIYTLVMWYNAAQKQRDYLRAKKDERWEIFEEFRRSYEERLKDINQDIDVMEYFQHA
mgnify:CR=1 FL=1